MEKKETEIIINYNRSLFLWRRGRWWQVEEWGGRGWQEEEDYENEIRRMREEEKKKKYRWQLLWIEYGSILG